MRAPDTLPEGGSAMEYDTESPDALETAKIHQNPASALGVTVGGRGSVGGVRKGPAVDHGLSERAARMPRVPSSILLVFSPRKPMKGD